jgi:hypothetical protein
MMPAFFLQKGFGHAENRIPSGATGIWCEQVRRRFKRWVAEDERKVGKFAGAFRHFPEQWLERGG